MMSLTSRGEPSIAELYAVYKQYHNSDTVIPTMQQRCRSKHAAFLNEFAKTQMFAVYCEAYQPADQAEPDLRGAEDNIEGGKPVAIE